MKRGPAHELTLRDFLKIVYSYLPDCGTMLGAYEEAEREVLAVYGRRKYKSYAVFRHAKCMFIKQKKQEKKHGVLLCLFFVTNALKVAIFL